jgi:hypothetical protein
MVQKRDVEEVGVKPQEQSRKMCFRISNKERMKIMKAKIVNILLVGVLSIIVGCAKTTTNSCNIAWDCTSLKPFTESYSDNFRKKGVFFIKGVALDTGKDGCNIRIIEDLKGNFVRKSDIFVWHSGSDIVRYYEKNDTLIMLLNECKNFDKDIDYATLVCTHSVLNISNGYVTGVIYHDKGFGQTAPWNELQKELKLNKK